MALTNKDIFNHFYVIGACIMSPTYFCVSLEEREEHAKVNNEEGDIHVRFCVHNLQNEKTKRWGKKEFEYGWASPIMVHSTINEFIIVDRLADVYYCGVGKNKQIEKPLNNYKGGLFGIKNINGTIYGAAVPRIMYKRVGPNEWIENDQLANVPGSEKVSAVDLGFTAIDGFSEDDIYAVGGERDVWHFDGKNWSPIDISRQPLDCTSVVCAEDGHVYIGGRFGAIARGRGDEWETYYPDELTHDIESIVSYRGRIFVGTQKQTFTLGEDLVPVPYDFEGQLPQMAGRYLYTAYDRLLVANNSNQVAFFDGEKWLNINGCEDMTADEANLFMSHNLDLLEEVTEHIQDVTEIIQKGKK